MDKVQIKMMNLNSEGNITSTSFSDVLTSPLLEVVQTVQRNARQEYWEIFDTPTGVVKMDHQGNVQMMTVRLVRD